MADVTLGRTRADAGDGHHRGGVPIPSEAPADPRAVRVGIGPTTRLADQPPLVVAPSPVPLAPRRTSLAGRGPLGGAARDGVASEAGGEVDDTPVTTAERGDGPTMMVDGAPVTARLVRRGPRRAWLVVGLGTEAARHRVVFTGDPAVGPGGLTRREVVVDGWRFDLELEPERRAALRERARRGREAAASGGPTEVRAIIPGRVASVSVTPGEAVVAGQQILVVEAMKMQNELRAPRDGTIQAIAVGPGVNIEVGDLLLVIE